VRRCAIEQTAAGKIRGSAVEGVSAAVRMALMAALVGF